MTDWTQLRQDLRERCHGYCEACGWPLPTWEWAAHHRQLRSQGGKDTLANLIAIHHSCHTMAPGSIHDEPEASYRAGQMVRMGSEPNSTPLRLPDGSWALLDHAYSPVPEPDGGHL